MSKIINLVCETCGCSFTRRLTEHNRNQKLGRGVFCSNNCSGKKNYKHLKKYCGTFNDNLVPGSKTDEFSPFRRHLLSAKQRKKECSLTLQEVKDQWDRQKGICPYTGWKLLNGLSMNIQDQLPLTPNRASLDRIDSSRGYHKDNIQFVSVIAQYAKHTFTEQDLIKFCQAVTRNQNDRK